MQSGPFSDPTDRVCLYWKTTPRQYADRLRIERKDTNSLDAEPPIALFLKSMLIGGSPVNAAVSTKKETVSDSDPTFIVGNGNPWKYGMSLRASNAKASDLEAIEQAASILGRAPFFVDGHGYTCELIAAAVQSSSNRVVYVESRAKKRWWSSMVDITIKIHYVDAKGKSASVDIESYNPFFGCDVGMMEWVNDDIALLIYSEKHWTFVYRIGDAWPPEFAKIDERWSIKDDVLSFMAYNADDVQRLQIPSLRPLKSVPISEAEEDGSLPPDPYAC